MVEIIVENVDGGERQNEIPTNPPHVRKMKNWKIVLFAVSVYYLNNSFKENTFSMEILSWMDLKVDPCEDFYKFSCGGFMEKHARFYKNYTDASFLVYVQNVVLIHNILESSEQLHGASEAARSFFSSCASNYTSGPGKFWCVEKTQDYFPDVIGRLFAEKVVTTEKMKKVNEYFQDISLIFQEKVRHWDFIDVASRETIISRLAHTSFIVGAPPHILDVSFENEVYKELSISEDLETNIRTMKAFNATRNETELDQCHRSGIQRAAFYLSEDDLIIISAGVLNDPYFSENNPAVLTYSNIGLTIAHEYAHALFKYAGDVVFSGTTVRKDRKKNYIAGNYCLLDSSYTLPNSDFTINEEKYTEEDFADMLGTEVAFKAFINSYSKEKNYDYQPLPGLERFTKEQLFFISAAQVWCRAYASEEIKWNLLKNPFDPTHSPPEFRVLIPMSNSIDFATAFNCPVGSNYNPEEKCSRYF